MPQSLTINKRPKIVICCVLQMQHINLRNNELNGTLPDVWSNLSKVNRAMFVCVAAAASVCSKCCTHDRLKKAIFNRQT